MYEVLNQNMDESCPLDGGSSNTMRLVKKTVKKLCTVQLCQVSYFLSVPFKLITIKSG